MPSNETQMQAIVTNLLGADVMLCNSDGKFIIPGQIRTVFHDKNGSLKYVVSVNATGELTEVWKHSFKLETK
jgi:hypothetical protein